MGNGRSLAFLRTGKFSRERVRGEEAAGRESLGHSFELSTMGKQSRIFFNLGYGLDRAPKVGHRSGFTRQQTFHTNLIQKRVRTMTSFPGRGPPGAPPPGLDDSSVDMRALKKAGGEFLSGETYFFSQSVHIRFFHPLASFPSPVAQRLRTLYGTHSDPSLLPPASPVAPSLTVPDAPPNRLRTQNVSTRQQRVTASRWVGGAYRQKQHPSWDGNN